MSASVIAASASGLAEQIGSYMGYASIVGLAVLALLYFSQAREVKRLRDWAGRAPERAADLGERVQADAQRRVVAQPISPTSPAAQQAVQQRTAAAAAAVYASVGATPPGTPSAPGQLARPAPSNPGAPAPGAVPPAPGSAAPPAPGAPAPGSPAAAPAPGTPPGAPAPGGSAGTQTPAPAPAAAGRPAVSAPPTPPAAGSPPTPAATAAARVAAQSRALPAPANGSQDTAESAAARPSGPVPYTPARTPVDDDDGGFGLSAGRVSLIVGGAVAAIAVAIVLVVVLSGEGETPPPPNDFGNTPAAQEPAGTPGPAGEPGAGASSAAGLTSAERRATNVAVLNGTTQTGLARNVGDEIEKAGFKLGSVGNNADQSVPTTIVSYTAGNEPAALAVARAIGIDAGSVRLADANTTAAADADVVVTVGSDQIE